MIRLSLAATLILAGPAFAECPPPKDLSAKIDPLMAQLRVAPDEYTARGLANELWIQWATAPDERAQELLDDGLRKRHQQDLRGAWDAFDQLVAYCPDYAEGYNQRAFVAFIKGEYQSALDDLEETLSRDPDHIAAIAGKALTEMAMNGAEAGQETLKQALALNPWLSERRFLLKEPGEEI